MKKVRLINWNVNSINSRIEHVEKLIKEQKPDAILLQEIKCEEPAFPVENFKKLGYDNRIIHGQKAYNGVAIISKLPILNARKGFSNESNILNHISKKEQASEDSMFQDSPVHKESRYVECALDLGGKNLQIASVYVPNGGANGQEAKDKIEITKSERFKYKLAFLDDFYNHLEGRLKYDDISIYAGDYNIAPTDLDVYSVKNWTGQICFLPQEKEKFFKFLDLGYFDSMREFYQNQQIYSWYNYRSNAFGQGKGIRIDHFLASPAAMDLITSTTLLTDYRGLEKPSDHVPMQIDLLI